MLYSPDLVAKGRKGQLLEPLATVHGWTPDAASAEEPGHSEDF